MRALRWHGPGDIRLEEVPSPLAPSRGEVQLEVLWCGICGTDIEEYRSGPIFIPVSSAPLTLGHEIAGRVVAVGQEGSLLSVGDVVGVDGLIGCGECRSCSRGLINLCDKLVAVGLMRDGGLAQFVNVPDSACVRVPDNAPLETGALAETLAVGVRALSRARLTTGEDVFVVGGGAVGLLTAQAARAIGAGSVTLIEPTDYRRDLARQLGVDRALSPGDPALGKADVVIECSGTQSAVQSTTEYGRKGARIVLAGITPGRIKMEPLTIVTNEFEIIGSLSHLRDSDFLMAVKLISEGSVRILPLIEHRLKLSEVPSIIDALANRTLETLKVLVDPSEDAGRPARGA